MAWEGPSKAKPVWCANDRRKNGIADGADRELHHA